MLIHSWHQVTHTDQLGPITVGLMQGWLTAVDDGWLVAVTQHDGNKVCHATAPNGDTYTITRCKDGLAVTLGPTVVVRNIGEALAAVLGHSLARRG